MACPPLDLIFFRRACTLCCGSPSKNSTLFSHNKQRTIAQRRKTRKKNFSKSAFSQNLILTFGLLSQFDQRRRWPNNADKSFMKLSLNYNTILRWILNKTLQCWAIADESAYLMTTWWLPDDCPDDCLKTAWWLPDECLTTVWQLPDNCPMKFNLKMLH